jgi:hypothetical protein
VNPRPPRQLEPQPGRLCNGRRDAADEVCRFKDDHAHAGPPAKRRQPAEPIAEATRTRPGRQVDDDEINGPAREQRPGDGQSFVEVRRADDDEPLRPHAAGHGFHRIQRAGEIQPGDDRAIGLGFGDVAQGEGRPAARGVAPERGERAARDAALAEDPVQRREAGRMDAPDLALERQSRRLSIRRSARFGLLWRLHRQRRDRERSHDLGRESRRSGTPACAEVGKRGGHGRRRHRHARRLEQMFY